MRLYTKVCEQDQKHCGIVEKCHFTSGNITVRKEKRYCFQKYTRFNGAAGFLPKLLHMNSSFLRFLCRESYPSCSNYTTTIYSISLMILCLRIERFGMLPGALWAFLLSCFFLSASVIMRLSTPALYIGFGKCLYLHNHYHHIRERISYE